MRIEVSHNFSIVCIYKDCRLVSIIDLDVNVNEVVKELIELFAALDIDCEVVEID